MNLIATAPIFQLNIYKYSVTNWEEKKPKLLQLLDFSSDDVLQSEVQSDFFTGKGNPSYFDEWINILKDDFNDIFNQGHVIAPLPVTTVDTNSINSCISCSIYFKQINWVAFHFFFSIK